jgi:hypothetical protein
MLQGTLYRPCYAAREVDTSPSRVLLLAIARAGAYREPDREPDPRVDLAADRPIVVAGETLRFRATVTNTGSVPREIGRGCAPGIDVAITTPDGGVRSATDDLLNGGEVRGMFVCLPSHANRLEPSGTDTVPLAWRVPAVPGRHRAVAQAFRGGTVLAASATLLIRVR